MRLASLGFIPTFSTYLLSMSSLPTARVASTATASPLHTVFRRRVAESTSRPLVGFGVLNDNLIKCLISFVKVYEQILSKKYKCIHGYITRSTIMMQMELCDQCV
jgi:hypothetical protein